MASEIQALYNFFAFPFELNSSEQSYSFTNCLWFLLRKANKTRGRIGTKAIAEVLAD